MPFRQQGWHLDVDLSQQCPDVSQGKGRDVSLETRTRFERGPLAFVEPRYLIDRRRRPLCQEGDDACVVQGVTLRNGPKTFVVAQMGQQLRHLHIDG